MREIFEIVVLPAFASGVLFLGLLATTTWIASKFGIYPQGYEARLVAREGPELMREFSTQIDQVEKTEQHRRRPSGIEPATQKT